MSLLKDSLGLEKCTKNYFIKDVFSLPNVFCQSKMQRKKIFKHFIHGWMY